MNVYTFFMNTDNGLEEAFKLFDEEMPNKEIIISRSKSWGTDRLYGTAFFAVGRYPAYFTVKELVRLPE